MLNIRAVGHRVVVKPDPVKKSQGGIILAVDHTLEQGATTTGTVLQEAPMLSMIIAQSMFLLVIGNGG